MKKPLLAAVAKAAKALEKVAAWPIKVPHPDARADHLFELYVLSRLIVDLRRANWLVVLNPGTGRNQNAVPRSPGSKASGWATFSVRANAAAASFEICFNTEIEDVSKDTRAPDISVQQPSKPAPTHAETIGFVDAKYRLSPQHRISSKEFSEFARWLDLLNVKSKKLPWHGTLGVFDEHALVTNGQPSTENDNERKRTAVHEVYDFHPKGSPKRLP